MDERIDAVETSDDTSVAGPCCGPAASIRVEWSPLCSGLERVTGTGPRGVEVRVTTPPA
jgi:hypothetical protein